MQKKKNRKFWTWRYSFLIDRINLKQWKNRHYIWKCIWSWEKELFFLLCFRIFSSIAFTLHSLLEIIPLPIESFIPTPVHKPLRVLLLKWYGTPESSEHLKGCSLIFILERVSTWNVDTNFYRQEIKNILLEYSEAVEGSEQ